MCDLSRQNRHGGISVASGFAQRARAGGARLRSIVTGSIRQSPQRCDDYVLKRVRRVTQVLTSVTESTLKAMRADAERNIEAVLRTGARLLAEDPGTSIATIAAAAGVDRRTVYRRFASREALRDAVLHTKLDAVDAVLDDARLDTAPVGVALHRFMEGVIAVARRYPIDLDQAHSDAESCTRRLGQHERIAAFLRRAIDEGLIRADLPDGMAEALLKQIVGMLARQFRDYDPVHAADIAVDALLRGAGHNVDRNSPQLIAA
jgi:AcrR family transcriptional regulator